MAGIGQDLKKIYSDETRIVENASLCSVSTKYVLYILFYLSLEVKKSTSYGHEKILKMV